MNRVVGLVIDAYGRPQGRGPIRFPFTDAEEDRAAEMYEAEHRRSWRFCKTPTRWLLLARTYMMMERLDVGRDV